MAIARLDWQLWDKLWHREITDQEIEVLLEWQSGRAEAMVAGGILIASLELYTFLRKNEMSPCRGDACRFGHRAGIRGSALLGLFAGVLPCLPLLGVLTFTALYTRDLWEGALYGLAFGSGKLFSPLIMLGILAGSAPALLSRYGRAFSYFTKLCGVVFILIGGSLIIPGLLPLW
jgi:sulfite exporter TauE/SafE